MSQERLPLIGSSGNKAAVPQRPSQAGCRKRSQKHHQPSSTSSSSQHTHHHSTPSSTLLPDTTMTPWGGLSLSSSSFTSIPPPPPLPPPAPPPVLQHTPASPYRRRRCPAVGCVVGSSPRSPAPSPPITAAQESAGRGGRGLHARRRAVPQRRVPRAPRLPPLRPVTNLSFSRSFTFSFFELPLHQTPRCRAERIRDLVLLVRQIQY